VFVPTEHKHRLAGLAVAQVAYLESGPILDERRRSPRTLRLSAKGETGHGEEAQVVVHDISDTGLLLESKVKLEQGEELEVILPQLGARRLTVAWASGRFFGCEFAAALPADAVEPQPKNGMDAIPKQGSPEAVSMAAVQLHELSLAIERISNVLDRAMTQLSKRDR
jgi:hypothetical protein